MINDLTPAQCHKTSKVNYDIEIKEISALGFDEKEKMFERIFNDGHCSFVYMQSMMPKNDILSVMRGEKPKREIRDMVFFKIEEEEPSQEKIVNDLAKKMEKKVAQLRKKGTNTKGILIVASPAVHPRNMATTKPLERLHGKVVDAHEHVEAAIIANKTTGPKGDPRFGGYILHSNRAETKTDLLKALETLETKGPLLS